MDGVIALDNVDVACIGEIMLESIISVSTQPSLNSTLVFRDDNPVVGGAVVNVAWYLSALGKSVRLVAPIAQNDVGLLQQELHGYHVDLKSLLVNPGLTDYLITTLTRDSHRSLYKLGSTPPNLEREMMFRSASSRSIVLNGGRHPDIRAAFIDVTEKSSVELIAFNPSYAIYEYPVSQLEHIIRRTDILIVNSDEYAYLKASLPTRQSPEEMPRLAFIHTKAQYGAQLFSKGSQWSFDSLVHREGTFIGAGDAFLSGFLCGILEGNAPEQAMWIGLRLAALVVEHGEIRTKISLADSDLLRNVEHSPKSDSNW